jgi:hypothetical protein
MRAMTKFDISNNSLFAEGGEALAAGLRDNQVVIELNTSGIYLGCNSEFGADMSGVIALADIIPDMGALSLLSLKKNDLLNKESGKAIADALKGNSVLTELDVSSNFNRRNRSSQDGSEFAQELAAGIKDNGALSKLIFGGDKYQGEKDGKWQEIYPEPAMLKMGMAETDFSNKDLGVGGAIIIPAWITQKDK